MSVVFGFPNKKYPRPEIYVVVTYIQLLRNHNMNRSHQDNFERPESLTHPTYVECPKCSGKAVISVDDPGKISMFSPRSLVCSKCTYRDRWAGGSHSPMPNYIGKDNHFELPLWLQVPCGKNFLFAYNENYIAILESYIVAELRSREKNEDHGWSNQSALSRLPAWIKSRKNRDQVLKGLRKLRERASNT